MSEGGWFVRWALAALVAFVTHGLFAPAVQGQVHFRRGLPPQYLHVAGGLGLAYSYQRHEDVRGKSEGGYAEVEYYWVPSEWVSPRAYGGLLLTFDEDNQICEEAGIECETSAKIGFLGIKGRLTVPIPYVAPFFELGLGASVGALRTRTLRIDEDSAIAYHVPVTLGLALGEDHQFEIAFAYLFHPGEKQFNGAIAFGLSFALDR